VCIFVYSIAIRRAKGPPLCLTTFIVVKYPFFVLLPVL
jgi:hypothetical protein